MCFREGWADYFEEHKIQYAFFSAANSTAIQEERARLAAIAAYESDEDTSSEGENDIDSEEEEEGARMKIPKSGNQLRRQTLLSAPLAAHLAGEDDDTDDEDLEEEEEDTDSDSELAGRMQRGAGISTPGSDEADRTRILSVLELEDLFLQHAPEGKFTLLNRLI